MATTFKPVYLINATIANHLMKIEGAKEKAGALPVTPTVLTSLRETARLYTTHYSTMIEGNQLALDEVKKVVNLHPKRIIFFLPEFHLQHILPTLSHFFRRHIEWLCSLKKMA